MLKIRTWVPSSVKKGSEVPFLLASPKGKPLPLRRDEGTAPKVRNHAENTHLGTLFSQKRFRSALFDSSPVGGAFAAAAGRGALHCKANRIERALWCNDNHRNSSRKVSGDSPLNYSLSAYLQFQIFPSHPGQPTPDIENCRFFLWVT